MPMELGQQVNAGTNLARLARRGEFFAELRIPEKQIKDVVLGQSVTIDTRTSKIQGLVKRIDPAVTNGSVQVDVQLTGDIPKEARPDLTIDGVIEIARISDTLFVKRPMFANSFTDSAVYMLDTEGAYANKKLVTFGQTSTKYIQIQSGLKAGENIIVSDSSAWQQHSQIRLN
jgi:multidrug efflux pump subunit AcrA (membrane-fusion protein)